MLPLLSGSLSLAKALSVLDLLPRNLCDPPLHPGFPSLLQLWFLCGPLTSFRQRLQWWNGFWIFMETYAGTSLNRDWNLSSLQVHPYMSLRDLPGSFA